MASAVIQIALWLAACVAAAMLALRIAPGRGAWLVLVGTAAVATTAVPLPATARGSAPRPADR